ncbi:MAG TPA: lycopene cyclase family protein [Solirubrobacteraceae bacterium]|nr:lycopene cyclase family protein [Solirubrobacteraceae bacterium]
MTSSVVLPSRIAILGAGLSGLSLACALREAGVAVPLLVIDRRTDHARDRTWCTWRTDGLRFGDCITHSWDSWELRSDGRAVVGHSARHPYVHLDADRVYAAALARLSDDPDTEIRLGAAVRAVRPGPPWIIETSAGAFTAEIVFDALGANSPLGPRRPAGAQEFAQRFLGWEIETDRPVFTPERATLMDFRAHAGPGVSFLYVLPFSPTRALLEHTAIEPLAARRVDRATALTSELTDRLGVREWRVLRRESGLIPMTTFPFPTRRGPGFHVVGAGAGAVRPSSGYAFSRIQGHVSAVARAVAMGRPLPRRVSHPRYDLLDRVFLQALAEDRAPEELFLACAGVPGDVFARFMTDTSTLAEEARLLAALPVREMTGAALGALSRPAATREWLRGLFG